MGILLPMNGTLRDFITARRTELRQQIQKLSAELDELERAEAALGSPANVGPAKAGRANGGMTIKDAILDVLANNPDGADAQEILAMINEGYGLSVVRTSLSPQLSRLKSEGKITLTGKVWARVPVARMQDLLG